ncbi:hypothetical protein N2152v2_005953 [Parachlorella kessleri]
MKHGVGRWVQILEEGLLPGKLIQQLNGQTQRLLGQQSLAAVTGLQVDIDRIRMDNETRTDVERKAGLIINTGPNLTKAMKEKLREEAKVKYGLTAQQVKEVEEQIADLRADMHKPQAGGRQVAGAEGVSLMGSDPASLSKEQKVALLRRLHNCLASAHAQLVKAMEQASVGGQAAEPAAVPAEPLAALKGVEARPTNSNAENMPAAANTGSMEVDPPAPSAVAQQQEQQQQTAVKPAGKAGGGKRKAAGSGGGGAGGAGAGAGGSRAGTAGAARRGRGARQKAVELDSESDGDWKPKNAVGGRGSKQGRSRRESSQGGEMQDDPKLPAGLDESALDAVAAANVRQLQDMGFTAQQAQQALDENGQDIEAALEWLAENCI